MELTALNVRSTVIFSSTDVGSGICRASTSLFDKLGGKFGSVVHLSLQLVNGVKFEVLCTLWPDSNGCFADGEICVDDTVQLKSGNVRPKWSECKCQVPKALQLVNHTSSLSFFAADTQDSSGTGRHFHTHSTAQRKTLPHTRPGPRHLLVHWTGRRREMQGVVVSGW